MKSHIWRPFYLALLLVAAILLLRVLLVPADFGIQDRGYMYGWHRLGNEAEWKNVSIKYRTAASCIPCHKNKYDDIKNSPHAAISCENCHGPNYDHPRDPLTLRIDRSRALCLRCHARLPAKGSLRGTIKGVDPANHYHEAECVMCHYPHNPKRPAAAKEVSP